jgi:RimJ/RimL family protein N-acetyltransferase
VSDAFLDRLRETIARNGHGFTAVELKQTGETIGFAGLSRTEIVPDLAAGTMEIGWRLASRYWGKGYVTEAGRELLRFGFEDLGEEFIVSFAVHDNRRSTAVMERLGMRREPVHDFDHPGIPETHAHLRPHVVYVLGREEWRERK